MEVKINREIRNYTESMFFGLTHFSGHTNVEAGHGLLKVGSSLVPFANKFPKNTKLYKLMTTKPGESA